MQNPIFHSSIRQIIILALTIALTLPGADTTTANAQTEVAPDGDLIGSPFLLASYPPETSYPALAWNSAANEYLAVWDVGYLSGSGIKARRFSAAGAPLGAEITVLSNSYERHRPHLAYNSGRGEYLVVWDQQGGEVSGQRISSSGALLGARFEIALDGRQDYYAQVAYNPASGEYLVVWSSDRRIDNVYDIFAQRVSGTGALIGANVLVAGGAGDRLYPCVLYNRQSNEYFVAWHDRRNATDSDIYGQRVGPTGVLIGWDIRITSSGGSQSYPAVAWDANRNQYLVVWVDRRGGQSYDIYGQKLAASGSLLGGDFAIAVGAGFSHPVPTELAWNQANDEYLVAWQGSQGIDAQRISGVGTLRGNRFSVGIGTWVGQVVYNAVANEYVIIWGWNSSSYGQRVTGQMPSLPSCANVIEIPRAECDALVALYNGTGGASWVSSSGWLATNAPCSWYGVTCAGGHVTELALDNNRLDGTIAPAVGNLSYLRVLSLSGNQVAQGGNLRGTIPSQLGSLSRLQSMSLAGNELTGAIPCELGSLAQLQYLNLCSNHLSGTIPPELGQLSSLYALHLCSNQLTGSIPAALGRLTNLTDSLMLYSNNLSGPIPSDFGQLTRLRFLHLYDNRLSSELPIELGNMSGLSSLRVSSNYLSGAVPSQLSNLSRLTRLELDHNLFRGALPGTWTRLTLNTFSFDATQLCEPGDVAFQAWLAGIPNLHRTGEICTVVTINFMAGAPGSHFLVTGCGFPPNTDATVSVNGVVLGTVRTDNRGCLSFLLFTSGADPGQYVVTVSVNPTASTFFRLAWDQPVRPRQGSGPTMNVPPGIAYDHDAYLPLVVK